MAGDYEVHVVQRGGCYTHATRLSTRDVLLGLAEEKGKRQERKVTGVPVSSLLLSSSLELCDRVNESLSMPSGWANRSRERGVYEFVSTLGWKERNAKVRRRYAAGAVLLDARAEIEECPLRT